MLSKAESSENHKLTGATSRNANAKLIAFKKAKFFTRLFYFLKSKHGSLRIVSKGKKENCFKKHGSKNTSWCLLWSFLSLQFVVLQKIPFVTLWQMVPWPWSPAKAKGGKSQGKSTLKSSSSISQAPSSRTSYAEFSVFSKLRRAGEAERSLTMPRSSA